MNTPTKKKLAAALRDVAAQANSQNEDPTGFWDDEEPNTPANTMLGIAIQVYSITKEEATREPGSPVEGSVTVGEVAAVFHITPRRAVRAIASCYWMYLEGDIGHITAEDMPKLSAQHGDDYLASLSIFHDGE